ncbi:MAG: YraN family protein [Alphaproteobacteria bacterium]|nr:YraN family protein [Alphaproteobacteria bacterium]MBN2893335.1 YraN family protein [Bacteroidales bacterium]
MLSKNKTSYDYGLVSEFLARWFLRFHGFKILESRYITGRNTNRAEIDIIARRGNLIIFVEVKKRKNIEVAFDAISKQQIARLRSAAENYIMKKHWVGDARFDVITVCGHHINWFKNAI